MVAGIALAVSCQLAAGQEHLAVPDDFLDFGRPRGDQLRVCLNMASAMVEFDRAVAAAIGDAILLPVEFFEIVDFDPPQPFDYRFTVDETQLFIAVNNECDALMGYPLPTTGMVAEWLTVSRPYLSTRMVLAVTDDEHRQLTDLPPGSRIGSRIGTSGDNRMRSYLRGTGTDTWTRVPYSANNHLIDRLRGEELAAALIWEPALHLFAGGDPADIGIHKADLPFDIAPTAFSIAVQSDDRFLLELLDDAIEAFIEDGTIDELLREYGLPEAR